MKIELMKLTNFRQFFGEQTVRFSKDTSRNTTVICGVTGAGKTSLMMALSWCLYGYEIENIGQLINKQALTETPEGFSIESKVQLVFTHASERYTATRVMKADRISQEKWKRDVPSRLTLARVRSDGQFETINNPTGFIESILPYNVSQYFFFDGEKIDQFTKPGHEDEVKSAVRNVLKIEVLERARTHLAFVAREYQQELKKKATGQLQTLLEKQDKLRTELEAQRTNLEKLRNERSAAQRQLGDINEQLSRIEEIRQWEEQRKEVVATIKAREEEKDRLWMTIRESTNKCFVLFAQPALEKALAVLDEKRARGEIPPGIREQFVQDLLTQERCICGRPVTAGSTEHDELVRLLGKSVSSALENSVIQTAGDLRSLLTGSDDILNQVKMLMKQKVDIENQIESLNQQLDEISRHLQGFDREEVVVLEKKRIEWHEQITLLAGNIGGSEERMNQLRKELEDLKVEISKAEIHEKSAKGLQRRLTLSSKATDALDRMCEVFATDMRQQIQKEALAIFSKLIWKDSQFQNVRVSDDYQLEVFDRWGLPARRELSAGERQLLSLAFIVGMAKVTEEEAPLVMDTPFGRLSSAPRENITQHVPEITKQLVLLVTDEELHSRARENLEPRIGMEYELVFDQAIGCTTIKQLR
jgi:DNA sulfur modification protein DndD